jgi:hypothetical protein
VLLPLQIMNLIENFWFRFESHFAAMLVPSWPPAHPLVRIAPTARLGSCLHGLAAALCGASA